MDSPKRTATHHSLRFLLPALFATAITVALRVLGAFREADAGWFRLVCDEGWSLGAAAQCLIGATIAFATAWAAMNIHSPLRRSIVVILAISQFFTLSFVLGFYGVRFSPLDPSLAAAVAWLIAEAMRGTRVGRELTSIRGLLGARANSQLATSIQAAGGLREFLNVSRTASIFSACLVNAEEFFDIAAATTDGPLAQSTQKIEKLAIERGAFVIQKDAQAITAVFGLDLNAQHARAAWELALDIVKQEANAKPEGVSAALPAPDWRFALEAGEVMPVLITDGFVRRLSLAGHCINNAGKLVLENLRFGSRICLSSSFYDLAGSQIEVRPLDLITLPGERHRQEIYELLGATGRVEADRLVARDAFWKGVVLFREGKFAEALRMFESARGSDEDQPLGYYLALAQRRCHRNAQTAAPTHASSPL